MMEETQRLTPLSTLKFNVESIGADEFGAVRSEQTEQEQDNPVRVVVISLFWTAFVLNIVAQSADMAGSGVIANICVAVATLLYALNLVYLMIGSVPGRGRLRGKGCDCGCSCLSRPYAVASAVFFTFSILNIIMVNAY